MKRKKGTSNTQSNFPNIIIPEEIIVEILSRLPLDSLARFTLVSKQWRSLISDISIGKTGPPIVLVVYDSGARAYSFSPHSIDEHQQEVFHTKRVRVPWNMNVFVNVFANRNTIRLLGSCKGLLLMHADEDLFLWNPLVRFCKKVLAFDRLRDKGYRVCSGLCYDSTSDEYKAVLALAHQPRSYRGEFVVVGSFRGKSWTMIHFPYSMRTVTSGPIVNENLHWYASKNDSGNYFLSPHLIIYFDAHMDKFEEVPMPDPICEDGDIICGLGALDGCLCMFRCKGEKSVELLVMKEYGVQNSWTSIIVVSDFFTSSPYYELLAPLGYTKNGEILTWGWERGRRIIRAFNRTDNSHRRISNPKGRHRHFCLTEYEESFITPTDYNWEEEEQKGEATYVEHIYRPRKMKKRYKNGYWRTVILKRNNMNGEPNSKEF